MSPDPPLTSFQLDLLAIAADNDGLWEFRNAVSGSATGAEAFRAVHAALIELVTAGYITLFGHDLRDLTADEATRVLANEENWVLPWEDGGDWHIKSDAYGVSLTPSGEAVRNPHMGW